MQVFKAVKSALTGLLPGRSTSEGNVGALQAVKDGVFSVENMHRPSFSGEVPSSLNQHLIRLEHILAYSV